MASGQCRRSGGAPDSVVPLEVRCCYDRGDVWLLMVVFVLVLLLFMLLLMRRVVLVLLLRRSLAILVRPARCHVAWFLDFPVCVFYGKPSDPKRGRMEEESEAEVEGE